MTNYREVLDERQLDAVRFSRRILDLLRSSAHTEGDGLRLAVFLMFLHFVRKEESFSIGEDWDSSVLRNLSSDMSELDPGRLERLRNEFAERLAVTRPNYLGIAGYPHKLIVDLFVVVGEPVNPETFLYRFDHLCDLVWGKLFPHAYDRKVEKFVAAFAQHWVNTNGIVLDGNPMTSGDIGVRLGTSATEYYIVDLGQSPTFELILKLHAHRVRYMRMGEPSLYIEGDRRPIQSFLFPPVGRTRTVARLQNHASWEGSGLEAANWFLSRGGINQQAVILISAADLKAKGWRAKARNELLAAGVIEGVLELPSRVAGRMRLCLLFLKKSLPAERARNVLFVDGRALDGLQDESLDRLAKFVSIPFSALDPRREQGTWEGWRQDLGDDLEQRAAKMFLKSSNPVPGFLVLAPIGEILDFSAHSLVPEDVIPPRKSGRPSAFLDGEEIRNLLQSERVGARCIYIIGDNGAGKSFLLKELAEILVAQQRPVRAVASASTDRFTSSIPENADYLYLGARASSSSTQARDLGRHMAELLTIIYGDRDRVELFNRVAESIGFQGRHYLIPATSRTDLFEKVRELAHGSDQRELKGMKLGLMKSNSSTIVPFAHLSSGEQQVLLLIAKLVAHASRDVVFLVDEPETSLHVSWQRALPNVLTAISAYFGCDVVVATHSPVVVSAATEQGDHRFAAYGGMLEPISNIVSSSVERVLFEGFGTYTVNNREVHERCAELVAQAIERVNCGRSAELGEIEVDLSEMEEKVWKSIPVLGDERTSRHLELIRRAKSVMKSLQEELSVTGQGDVNG